MKNPSTSVETGFSSDSRVLDIVSDTEQPHCFEECPWEHLQKREGSESLPKENQHEVSFIHKYLHSPYSSQISSNVPFVLFLIVNTLMLLGNDCSVSR